MDVYEITQAVQDLVDASAGSSDAYAFEAAWTAIDDYCKDHDLLDDGAALVAESILKPEANVLTALRQCHQRQGKQKAAYDTRKKVWAFLVELLSRLEPQQVAQYAPDITQAASHHGRVEENAHVRNAALDALTFILNQVVEGRLPVSVLPDSPTALAAPLQRIYLSSEARDKSTLKAALLGVLGLLLQLIDRYNPAANPQQPHGNPAGGFLASRPAGTAGVSGVELLNRHWLLQMCRGELSDGSGELSSAKASEGTVEGMTAALCLMQPGEADADLSAMLNLCCSLLHDLAQALTYKNRYEKYGRYKAAAACLQQLGQRMAAARLFTRPPPAATAGGGGAGSGVVSTGAVLLHDLMLICAGSPNKDMRNAAEDTMATVAGLMFRELLESRSPDGAAVLQHIIRICNEEFAGVGATATAAAARRAAVSDSTAGADGQYSSPESVPSSGWMRGAVEVLGQLVPAVAQYQGVKGLRNVVASLLPLANSSTPLISGVDDLQDAPVERECSLLRALASAAAAQQSLQDEGQQSGAIEAALRVARRLIGSYLYQWPSQRLKTQAAIQHLLTAAAGDPTAAASGPAPAAAGHRQRGTASAASSGSSSSVLMSMVVETFVSDLLAATLRQMTPQELIDGPIIVTDDKQAAAPDMKPWEIYKGLWLALLNPSSSSSNSSGGSSSGNIDHLSLSITNALYDALMEASLSALHPAAIYVLDTAASTAAAAATPAAEAAGDDAAARKAAASVRLAAATQDLEQGGSGSTRLTKSAAAAVGSRRSSAAGGSSSSLAASRSTMGVGRYMPSSAGTAAATEGGGDGEAAGGTVKCDDSVLVAYNDLATFLSNLLISAEPQAFTRWAYPLTLNLAAAATLNPGIQGLYLLANSALNLASSAGLLLPGLNPSSSSREGDPKDPTPNASNLNPNATVEREQITALFRNFLPRVVGTLEVLSENSLHAALQLLLSPAALSLLPQSLKPVPLEIALRVGLTNPPVAAVAVAALEAWEQQQPWQLKGLLHNIIPLLNPYLEDLGTDNKQSNTNNRPDVLFPEEEDNQALDQDGDNRADDGGTAAAAAAGDVGRAVMSERRRQTAAASQTAKAAAKAAAKQGLAALQPRIQLWLGRQGGPAAAALAAAAAAARTGGSSVGSSATDQIWCETPLVGITTTFPTESGGGVNLEVFLDGILPQLVSIAESDSSRARRVAAYEGLHALALWLIGNMAQVSQQLSGSDSGDQHAAAAQFSSLARRLWPALLRLAAAGDAVAWQLFGALMDQIGHWLGSKSDADGAAATVLMESLLDAMCGSSSSSDDKPSSPASGGNSSSRGLVQLSSLLYGELLRYAVTRSDGSTAKSSSGGINRTGRQLIVRLLDRLGRLSTADRVGAAEGLAACARSLSCRVLLSAPLDATLLVEAHLIDILRRLVLALGANEGEGPGSSAAAAAIRRAIAVLLQQWLAVCVDVLAQPAGEGDGHGHKHKKAYSIADYNSSPLGQFLSWLWLLTSTPVTPQRMTAQQLMSILAREMLAAAAAEGVVPMAVDGQSDVAIWLSAIHCNGSTTQQQDTLRDSIKVKQQAQPPPTLATALLQSPAGAGDGTPDLSSTAAAAAAAGSSVDRGGVLGWLQVITGAADWCCWALEQGCLDVSELHWQIRRLSPTPTAIDGIAQLISLLPDLASGTNWGFSSGQILIAAAGSAEVQQAVITTVEFLKRVVGSGMYEAARDRVFKDLQQQQQQQQQGVAAAAAAAAAAASGVGGIGRLCLIGLLMPEKLGFTAAEVPAKAKLDAAIAALLETASTQQPDVLQQLQTDLVALLQRVVVPKLMGGAALREPGLSAITRIMTGVIMSLNLLPSITWPGGYLLAPGGQQLQTDLAQASLSLALRLVGLPTAAAAAAGSSGGGEIRPPPQIVEAADSAFQLALQLGLPHSQLLALLLQPSQAGQKMYHTFAKRLQTWCIFNADQLLPDLVTAIAAPAAAAAGSSEESAAAAAAGALDPGLQNAAAAAEGLLIGCLQSLTPAAAAAAAGGSGSRRFGDIRTSTFVRSVLANLPKLKHLLSPTALPTAKPSLLKILTAILNLDARSALNPKINPSFGFVIDCFIQLLDNKSRSVQDQQMLSQGLGLLGSVLTGLQQQQQAGGNAVDRAVAGIVGALQQIAVNEWGTTTRIDRKSPAGIAYRDQLLAITDALMATAKAATQQQQGPTAAAAAAAGSADVGPAISVPLQLIDVLLQELQKMGRVLEPKSARDVLSTYGHPFHDQLELRLAVAAAAVWTRNTTTSPTADQQQQQQPPGRSSSTAMAAAEGPPAAKKPRLSAPQTPAAAAAAGEYPCTSSFLASPLAQELLIYCWDRVVLDSKSYTAALRLALLQYLLLPLLELAPVQGVRADWYEQHIEQLRAVAEHGNAAAAAGVVAADQSDEARRLVSRLAAYRLLELMYDIIDKDHLERVVGGLPKKHATLVAQATKDARELTPIYSGNEVLARAVRCGAYAMAVNLLRSTQAKANLYAPAFKGGKGQTPCEMFSQLLDVSGLSELTFSDFEARGYGSMIGAGRRTQRRQQELQALQQAAAGSRSARGSSGSSQLFSISGGVMSLSSQSLGVGGSSMMAQTAGLPASQMGGSIVLPPSIAAAAAAASQQLDPAAAAATAGEDGPPDDSQPLNITSWTDVDMLQQTLNNSGITMSPEEFVTLSAVLKPGLSIDDVYDAHPAMLRLVRLMEKAITLPSDVQGDMPTWMSLIVQILDSTPEDDHAASRPVKIFLFKAILHVEIRARQQRQQQQQELQAWKETAAAAEAAGLLPPPPPAFAAAGSDGSSSSSSVPENIEVYVSDTLFAQFADRVFPGMVAAVLPAAAVDPGSSSSGGGGKSDLRFHYVLRDFVVVILMWSKLFERSGDDGPLTYESSVADPGSHLLRHLCACGFDPADSTATRNNLRFIVELMKRWGSTVTIAGADIVKHVGPAATAAASHASGRGTTAAGRGSRSAAGSSSSGDKRVLYGLELLGQAVGRGQTAALMAKGDAARRLWSVLLQQLQQPKITPTRAQMLGRTTALLLLGLTRLESRQAAAAAAVTAAGGPAVRGVVELQVSSRLVAAELSDALRLLFNSGKHQTLIKMLEGASSILAQATSPPPAAANTPSAAAAAAAIRSRSDGSRSRSDDPRSAAAAADDLLWVCGSVSVVQWLLVSLEKVELQYKGIALGLLMTRCSTSPEAAKQLADQLPRLAPSTLSYNRSTAVQLAALQLANLLLPHMSTAAAAAEFVLSQVPIFLQHRDADCRGQLLQLVESAWRLLDGAGAAAGGSAAAAGVGSGDLITKQLLESVLFVLLCDRSASVRSSAMLFWHNTGTISSGLAAGSSHTVLLPAAAAARLTVLLDKTSALKPHLQQIWERSYSSTTAAAGSSAAAAGSSAAAAGDAKSVAERICVDAERQWPCVAAALLLRLPAAVGSAWDSGMFTQNLGSAKFEDYPIQTQAGATFTSGGGSTFSAALSQFTTPSQAAAAAAAAADSLILTAAAAATGGSSTLSDVLRHSAEQSRLSALGLLPAAAGGAGGFTVGSVGGTLGLTQAAAAAAAGPARGLAMRGYLAANRFSRRSLAAQSTQSLGSTRSAAAVAADESAQDLRALDYARARRTGSYKRSATASSYRGGAEFHKLELRRRQHAAAAAAARAANIKLVRSYRTGEYPDIEAVTAKSIWAPLTVLATQRPAVASSVLAAVMSSFVAAAAGADDSKGRSSKTDARSRTALKTQLIELRSALSSAFAAAPRAPEYVDALQQLSAADRSLWLDPDHVLQAAESSGGLGAAAVQIEEQMMYADPTGQGALVDSAATASKQRGAATYPITPKLTTGPGGAADTGGDSSSVNEPEPASCWRALADLYSQLAEPDVLGLVQRSHLVKCPGTLKALEASAAGRHRVAYELYDKVLDDAVNAADEIRAERDAGQQPVKAEWYGDMLGPVAVPSKCEEGLVFSERLACLEQLESWAMIQEQVEADVNPDPDDESSNPNLAELFTSPNKEIRDYLLPYIRACVLSGDAGHAALTAPGWGLLATAEQSKTWLKHLEETAGVELAVLQLLGGSIAACQSQLTDTLRTFTNRWSSTATSSLSALLLAAATLQPAAELQELLALLQSAAGSPVDPVPDPDHVTMLQHLIRYWNDRWPEIQTSDSQQLLLILGLRRQLIQALEKPGVIRSQQQRQQLAAASKVLISGLQLHAADQLLHSRCIDSARVLLEQHSSDVQLLLQGRGAASGVDVQEMHIRGCIAAAQLSVLQLHASPSDPDSRSTLERDLKALEPYAASALKTAHNLGSSSSGRKKGTAASSGQLLLLDAHALVTKAAAAAAALAKHLASTAEAGGTAGRDTDQTQQNFATAVEDYHAAAALLQSQDMQQQGKQEDPSSSSSSSSIGKVLLEFGLLCSYLHHQQQPQQQQGGPSPASATLPAAAANVVRSSGGLAALAVRNLLAAMAAGSSSEAASLHIPTVLAAMAPAAGSSSGSSAACEAFKDGWSAVPLHVYLPWVSQLLARWGSEEGEVLVGTLEALARRYPQRVYLPFQMSQQHWTKHARDHKTSSSHRSTHKKTPQTPPTAAAAAVERASNLGAILSGPNLGDLPAFVQALDAMTGPKQRLVPWEGLMVAAFNGADTSEVVRLWSEEVYPDIIGQFAVESDAGAPRSRRTRQAETANQRFAKDKEVSQVISKFGGPSGAQLANMNTASFRQLWAVMVKVASKLDAEQSGTMALERLSSWFGQFADLQGNSRVPLLMPKMLFMSNIAAFALEHATMTAFNTHRATGATASSSSGSSTLPGSSYLVTDSGSAVCIHDFGKYVTTFASKQKPKLITIYGSDFREHKFVVKGGEDARLDERIEQIFTVMSGLAAQHTGCVSRGLHKALVTYDVVPASPRLGLLGFVEGTAPMGNLITSTLSNPAQEAAHKAYIQGLPHKPASAGGGIDMKSYERAWSTKTDDFMVNCLKKAESHIPWDALRHVLRRRAVNPEAWLSLRHTYTITLAASSAAGYLVGLGDRHLGNLLVVEGTGAVVPIDFGYSFGTAVLALPVAELPPFRLTRQLRNVLLPHDAAGLLQPAMAAWLDAALDGQQVLASILQVFLAEPLGEWQRETGPLAQLAMAAAAAGGDDSGEQQAAAVQQMNVANLKVNQVLQRIAGHNPVGIICTEAQAKHGATPAWPAMERVLNGAAIGPSSIRQQVPSKGMVEGGAGVVANLLLELATDDRISSRCYEGWRPYL